MLQLRTVSQKENRCGSCAHAPAQDSFLERKQMWELCACASSRQFPIKKTHVGVVRMCQLRKVSQQGRILELYACASSGQFPSKEGFWSCTHASAQDSFLARKHFGVVRMRQLRTVSQQGRILELYACVSSGQFPSKEGFWSCAHAPAQHNVLERQQMFRSNLCDGIRQNCYEMQCLFGHAFMVPSFLMLTVRYIPNNGKKFDSDVIFYHLL